MVQRIGTRAIVPLTRLAHSHAFFDYLRSIDASVERAFCHAQLPYLCDNPDAYVPTQRVRQFLYEISEQGVEGLGWVTGVWAQERYLHKSLLQCLAVAPTLGCAIEYLATLVSVENSHYYLSLDEYSQNVRLWMYDTFAANKPGYHIAQSYWLMSMLAIIRRFAGTAWQPLEIGIELPVIPQGVQEILPNTRVKPRQKSYYIEIPHNILHLPPDSSWTIKCCDQYTEERLVFTDRLNFTGSLRLILESYLAEDYFSVDLVAGMINTSSRTLRRRLVGEGVRFSALVDEVRFSVARRLLARSGIKMIDIAFTLGYSDPSHFARSFRRITGLSPSDYRHARCILNT